MRIPFPPHLRYTPIVLLAPDGTDETEIGRHFMALCRQEADGRMRAEDRAAVDAFTGDGVPECVVPAQWLQNFTDEDGRAQVERGAATLAETLSRELPRGTDETDVAAHVTALAKAFAGLPAGTVVYDRRTDRTHVLFLMEHIRIGLHSGVFRLVDVPAERPAPAPAPAVVVRRLTIAATVEFEAGNPEAAKDEAFLECALSLGSCLAWGLPPPMGPVVAGALSVLQVLFGMATAPKKPDGPDLGKLLSSAVTAIDQYISANSIKSDAARLSTFATWITSEVRAMDKLGALDQSPEASVFRSGVDKVIGFLEDSTGPNGSLDLAITDLQLNYLFEKNSENDTGLNLCVTGVALHLMARKLIMQLRALKVCWMMDDPGADAAEIEKLRAEWRLSYSEFVTALEPGGIAARAAEALTLAVGKWRERRLGKIVAEYVPSHTERSKSGLGTFGVYADITYPGYWRWRDGDTIDPVKYEDREERSGCCNSDRNTVHREAEARAACEKHRTQVAAEFDAKYRRIGEAIALWQAGIRDWREHEPPPPPKTAPAIDVAGWTGPPPARQFAPAWVAGSTVAYAVAFANQRGFSAPGPFSEAVPIHPECGATVIHLPADPLGMADTLRIHRRITTEEGRPIDRIGGVVPAGTERWQDTEH
jgi:hypothetical protein